MKPSMRLSVAINAASGQLTFGEYSIALGSRLKDVPRVFAQRELVSLKDGQAITSVVATATHEERGTMFELALAYQHARLVRITLCIEPAHLRNLPGDAFYESVQARYDYHQKWLQKMGLSGSAYARVAWGIVGVARDKSENVFIYLNEHEDARSA
jgi:hypothetical protein